jgi:hypothetical protein
MMMSQQNVIICDRENTISAQRKLIFEQEKEIQALMEQLTAGQPATGQKKEKKEFHPAKLSYRSLAQQRSKETIKPPADSASALEERVKKEGGTV